MVGVDAIAGSVISGVAIPIFRSIFQGSSKLFWLFGKRLNKKTKLIIFQASELYVQNYTERHGIVKVLGMRKPRNLTELYTKVRFLDEADLNVFMSLESIEQGYRQTQGRSLLWRRRQKKDGLYVANETSFLMVLGGPGTGKSTFLRRIGLEALYGKHGEYVHHCIPVLIELKTLRYNELNLICLISEEFRICKFPNPEEFTIRALEQGRLLVLLDGLDEVPTDNLNITIDIIQDFVDLYSQNKFIISCRTAAYKHNFRRFTDVAIAEFDDSQIQQFISNWFSSSLSKSQNCWLQLCRMENVSAKELTHTPLLLTLVCLLFEKAHKFPGKRADLYEKALRVLLEEWAGEKGIHLDEIYRGLGTRQKEMVLAEIAYKNFKDDKLFFQRRQIGRQIEDLLKDILVDEPFIDGEAVLKSIELQHGILVERAESVYSFSHLTLQEYLTAQYICDRNLQSITVEEHLTDPRWKEVFLLVSGLLRGGSDSLLLNMEEQAIKFINTKKLSDLFIWAEDSTSNSLGEIRPANKRLSAIILTQIIAKDIDYIYDGKYNLSNFDPADKISLSTDIDLDLPNDIAQIPNIDYGYEITYDDEIFSANSLAQYLGLNLDISFDLSSEIDLAYNLDTSHDLDLDLVSDLADSYEELAIFRAVNFKVLKEDLKSLYSKIPIESSNKQKWIEENHLTWLHNLDLTANKVCLSETERKNLTSYFQVQLLIIQCKLVAARVSRKTWNEIEDRMFSLQICQL